MTQYRTVLLFGAPGSGKGTQGKAIGALGGFHHCACGDVFRALDPKSELGKVFAEYGKTGSLVPDELTIELWRQTISARVAGGLFKPATDILLLDGIPRTVEQAQLLQGDLDVIAIIHLFCYDVEQIVKRLKHRALKDTRPDDSNEEVIRHRLDVYEEQTRPVLEFYSRGRIFRVDATREQEVVTADILKILTPLQLPHIG